MIIKGKDILEAKNRRAEYIKKLSNNQLLITLQLNIPGNIKDQPKYRLFAKHKFIELLNYLQEKKAVIVFQELSFHKTGVEGYCIINNLSADQAKEYTLFLEEKKPSGRILDIDVIFNNNRIERKKKRSCYLCDDLAINCAREKRHSINEILEHINQLIEVELRVADLLLKKETK
ncbi:MAG: citrate lyase holo-[acyl-carrier protein] synthase [Candidatus Kariarchaeaceae archaeon]